VHHAKEKLRHAKEKTKQNSCIHPVRLIKQVLI